MSETTDLGIYLIGNIPRAFRWHGGQIEVRRPNGAWVASAIGATFPKPLDAAEARQALAQAPWLERTF